MTPVSYKPVSDRERDLGISLTQQAKAVAEAFVSARREKRALSAYPGQPPQDMAEGYAIQDHAIALDGRPVSGWKVGRINAPDDTRLGANRLAGPIFADEVVFAADVSVPEMPVFADGFAAAEAEFLLHVGAGWDGTIPTDDAGTRAIVDDVRIGIEVASSPYPRINADGPPVTASDFGNNAGLVIGAAIPDWQDMDLSTILVRLEIEGQVIGEKTTATMLDGPYGAVRFLLSNLKSRDIDCGSGVWVSTGAVTGVHDVRPGEKVVATFGDLGSVGCLIVAAKPD